MKHEEIKSILISIHPEHVDKIITGEKCFEYRKTAIKAKNAVIYATSPIKKIIAIANIEGVISGKPQSIWRKTRGGAGISYGFFNSYFSGRDKAHAIKLGAVKILKTPLSLCHDKLKLKAPQSFIYLNVAIMHWLNSRSSNSINIKSKLIFIAGIHGAGKTTLAQKAFSPFGYESFGASQLIKESAGEVRKDKLVSKIDDNQCKLLKRLALKRKQYCRIVLDGHFCLIDNKGDIEDIPLDVFLDLNPTCIVLAMPAIKLVKKRLRLRSNLLQLNVSLKEYYKREYQRAKFVADSLSIPLYKLDTGLENRQYFKHVATICEDICSIENKSV